MARAPATAGVGSRGAANRAVRRSAIVLVAAPSSAHTWGVAGALQRASWTGSCGRNRPCHPSNRQKGSPITGEDVRRMWLGTKSEKIQSPALEPAEVVHSTQRCPRRRGGAARRRPNHSGHCFHIPLQQAGDASGARSARQSLCRSPRVHLRGLTCCCPGSRLHAAISGVRRGTGGDQGVLVARKGRPMVLLHADRDNRLDWRWVLARLATTAYTPPTSRLRWLLLRLPLLFANPACVPQPWLPSNTASPSYRDPGHDSGRAAVGMALLPTSV